MIPLCDVCGHGADKHYGQMCSDCTCERFVLRTFENKSATATTTYPPVEDIPGWKHLAQFGVVPAYGADVIYLRKHLEPSGTLDYVYYRDPDYKEPEPVKEPLYLVAKVEGCFHIIRKDKMANEPYSVAKLNDRRDAARICRILNEEEANA